jgi:hypothetical protein
VRYRGKLAAYNRYISALKRLTSNTSTLHEATVAPRNIQAEIYNASYSFENDKPFFDWINTLPYPEITSLLQEQ